MRCVISTSFADIFYNNCFKNGILPIKVPQADLDKLMDDAERGANADADGRSRDAGDPRTRRRRRHIRHRPVPQTLPAQRLDDIGLTLQKADKIDAFEKAAAQSRPWA